MLATSRTRSGHPTLSFAVRPSRSRALTGVLIVGAVEAALVALFLLGWTTAVPAPGHTPDPRDRSRGAARCGPLDRGATMRR